MPLEALQPHVSKTTGTFLTDLTHRSELERINSAEILAPAAHQGLLVLHCDWCCGISRKRGPGITPSLASVSEHVRMSFDLRRALTASQIEMEGECGDKHAAEEASHEEDECNCVGHPRSIPQSLGERFLNPLHRPHTYAARPSRPHDANPSPLRGLYSGFNIAGDLPGRPSLRPSPRQACQRPLDYQGSLKLSEDRHHPKQCAACRRTRNYGITFSDNGFSVCWSPDLGRGGPV
jgi:hypothetical protein